MSTNLPAIDWLIIAAYLVASMAIGAWFGRGKQTAESFLVGGRQIGWPLLLASIVATETSTVTFLSLPGQSYADGGNFTFLQLAFGYIVGRLLVVAWLLPMYFRGEYLTAYELLEAKCGPTVRRVASAIFLVTRNVGDGLRLLLTGLLVAAATGVDFATSVVLLAVCTAIYAAVGGVASVVVNDFVQLITYTAGAFIVLASLLGDIPGGAEGAWDFAAETGRLKLFDFSLSLTSPTITLLAGVVGGAALSMASHGADHMMVQRYLCARTQRSAALALGLSGLVVAGQFLLFLVIGVALAALFQADPPDYAAGGGDDALIGYIVHALGPGLRGLVVASVLAASMSTLSSSLNASAGVAVADLGRLIGIKGEGPGAVRAARVATLVAAAAQVAVALVARRMEASDDVIGAVLAVLGFATGLILGLYALASALPRVTTAAGVGGLAAGCLACSVAAFGVGMSWPWFSLVGSTTTFCVGWWLSFFAITKAAE